MASTRPQVLDSESRWYESGTRAEGNPYTYQPTTPTLIGFSYPIYKRQPSRTQLWYCVTSFTVIKPRVEPKVQFSFCTNIKNVTIAFLNKTFKVTLAEAEEERIVKLSEMAFNLGYANAIEVVIAKETA